MTPIRGEDKEPGCDTLAAWQIGKAANSPNHPVSNFTDVFVGRGHELKELSEALEDARNGSPGIAVLVGEAGIGKTRTAQEFAAHAEREGARVLWGRCYEGEKTPPYGPWTAALRAYIRDSSPPVLRAQLGSGAADIAEIVPELKEKLKNVKPPPWLPRAEARIRLFEALIGFLQAVSQDHVLVLVLDNLHWADTSSLRLLEHLGCEITSSRMLILGTYRDLRLYHHPLAATLGELIKQKSFHRIHLDGLSREDVGAYLAKAMNAEPMPALTEKIHQRTDGNPLFMVELVRGMREHSRPEADGAWIPEGIREAIGQRLNRLSQNCSEVLSTASVIGRTFDLEVLSHLTGESDDRLLQILDQALAEGMIEEIKEVPGRYGFAHVLIQETVSDELSVARKTRCHARIAEVMENLYGSEPAAYAGELVRHFAEAVEVLGAEKLVHYTLLASEYALSNCAPDEAVSLLDRTLAIMQARAPREHRAETATLLHCRGRALDDMGSRETEASLVRAFDIYAELGDVENAVRVALSPARHLLRIGSFETSIWVNTGVPSLLQRALKMVSPGSMDKGRLLSQAAGPIANLEKALAIAKKQGDQALEMWALARLAVRHTGTGDFAQSEREHARALQIAGELDDHVAVHFCLYWSRYRYCITGETQRAWTCNKSLMDTAKRTRSRHMLFVANMCTAISAHLSGDWEKCREHAMRTLSLAPAYEETYANMTAFVVMAMTEFQTGHFDIAEKHLRTLGEISHSPEAPAPFVIPKIVRITGDTRRLDTGEAILRRMPQGRSPFTWATICRQIALAITAVLREDTADSAAYLEYFLPWKACFGGDAPTGTSIDALLGLLCTTLNRYEEAEVHFEDALEFCSKAQYLPELAWSYYDYAEALLQKDWPGDRQHVQELLDQGKTIAVQLGMRPLLKRIEHSLERMRGAMPERPAYPGGLTQREVEILSLVARGFTNKEIGKYLYISANTVATHIQNILKKTGTANRTEATAFAIDEGLVD